MVSFSTLSPGSPVRSLWLACLAGSAGALSAQHAAAPPDAAVPLDRVVVKGQALPGAQAPFSVAALDPVRIRELRPSHPQDLFREVPGMAVRSLGLGGVADTLVLRGFGGGGHGGDIGVVLDGIPLNEAMSHADGYVDFGVIVPLEIGAMNVYAGPVSALYGNYNRAGLIAVETRRDGGYAQADVSAGAHETFDAQAAAGFAPAAGHRVNGALQHYRTAGFRPQSDFARTTLSGRWAWDASPALTLALAGRYYTGEGDSASYLTRTQYDRDPYGIDPRVRNDGSEKEFATVRADASARAGPGLRLLGFVYGTRQSFTRWFTRPLDPTRWAQRGEAYDRDVRGAGANLNGRHRLAAGALNWVAGAELFRESTRFRFDDNLDHRRRVNPAISNRTADLDSDALFAEVEAPLHARFKPWVAFRHDRFDGGAVRNGPETGTEPLGPMPRTRHTSPKIGVRSDVAPGVQLRASWAEGFALAPNFAKYSPGAADLDPNVFRQTEAGAAWRPAPGWIFDAALYRIRSTGEILAVGPGVFQNFGGTERTGFETKAGWRPRPAWHVTAVYGRADSAVKRNPNAALVGRRVTGVPRESATFGVQFAPAEGWGANATLRHVGRYAADAPNTLFAPAYTVLDAGVAYAGVWSGRRYRAYAAADNLGDRVHATSVSLIGGTPLLAPGAPLTWKAGVQFDF